MRRIFSSQTLLTAAVAIIAVALFNLSRPSSIESDLAVGFNTWYVQTAPLLEKADAAALANVKLTVTIGLTGRSTPPPSLSWTLPARSLTEATDRENTARVLQLVSESGVFNVKSIKTPEEGVSYLTISVKEGENSFETTVQAEEIDKSIQLQNLLKLLDVFSKTDSPVAIEPSRT